jgi:mRNA interferase MazF
VGGKTVKARQGEVWFAELDKRRPVVIVSNQLAVDLDYIVAKVTSQNARGQFDIALEYWKEAGLDKPSVARTNKLNTIYYKELLFKVGTLTEFDLKRVLDACRNVF